METNLDSQDSSQDTSVEQHEEVTLDDSVGVAGNDGDGAAEESQEGAEAAAEGAEGEDAEAAAAADGATAEEEPWQPGKYKVDGKELDYDEKLKPFLTKENEAVIRELVEKSSGLDSIKTRHEEVKQERDVLRRDLTALATDVHEVMEAKKAGDYHAVLDALGIPFNTFAQWMYQELKTQEELPEHLRGMYHQNRQSSQQSRIADKEMAALRQQTQDALAQAQGMQLDTALANPNIAEIVAEFDGLNGAGSFRQSVIEWAAGREHATQKTLTVQEAVSGYLKVIGRQSTPASKPAAVAAKPKKPVVVAPHKPTTIPKVDGSASAAMGKKPKSIDELRKMSTTRI